MTVICHQVKLLPGVIMFAVSWFGVLARDQLWKEQMTRAKASGRFSRWSLPHLALTILANMTEKYIKGSAWPSSALNYAGFALGSALAEARELRVIYLLPG